MADMKEKSKGERDRVNSGKQTDMNFERSSIAGFVHIQYNTKIRSYSIYYYTEQCSGK